MEYSSTFSAAFPAEFIQFIIYNMQVAGVHVTDIQNKEWKTLTSVRTTAIETMRSDCLHGRLKLYGLERAHRK